ncbi:MAG TPA: sigma-70 family RNA polymerase sigma factor [Candidatus Acidoferrum sp.]|nr:sigma-70 family RNA polymerase sigma factor [Candidatus Acidoferrum sp.]
MSGFRYPHTEAIERLYRQDSRRIYATLVRLLGNFALAEDMLQEAFITATQEWPVQGMPDNPVAWLITVARNRGLDRLRREQRQVDIDDEQLETHSALHYEQQFDAEVLEDDRLRLIFTCCHPALAPEVQIALTLREVCGLDTEAIASAFLVQTATMAQRIVRGKAKIRTAGIAYIVPEGPQLAERLESVLSVIYLVYTEGHHVSRGEVLFRVDLCIEAIRLARLVMTLLPEPEVKGLLALLLLTDARRPARSDADGNPVLLEDQDRTRWRSDYIAEGKALLDDALAAGHVGPYLLQAAIAAVHADAASFAATDWAQIVALYDLLWRFTESPVVALNRAVAVTMRDGPAAALPVLETLAASDELAQHYPAHAAVADAYRRLGQAEPARAAYLRALALVQQEPDRRLLERRLAELT